MRSFLEVFIIAVKMKGAFSAGHYNIMSLLNIYRIGLLFDMCDLNCQLQAGVLCFFSEAILIWVHSFAALPLMSAALPRRCWCCADGAGHKMVKL